MRAEQKFIIDFNQYHIFREYVRFVGSVDSHRQCGNSYPVFSQYYDTKDLDFFYDKLNGEYEHIKVRKRQYSRILDLSEDSFFEGKLKHKEMIRKIRFQTKDLKNIDIKHKMEYDFFKWILSKKQLYPTCNVFYIREAYFIPHGTEMIRLNFDSNLLYLNTNQNEVTDELYRSRRCESHPIILEIKSSSVALPRTLTELLLKTAVRKTRFSKYASCISHLIGTVNF